MRWGEKFCDDGKPWQISSQHPAAVFWGRMSGLLWEGVDYMEPVPAGLAGREQSGNQILQSDDRPAGIHVLKRFGVKLLHGISAAK